MVVIRHPDSTHNHYCYACLDLLNKGKKDVNPVWECTTVNCQTPYYKNCEEHSVVKEEESTRQKSSW